MTEAVTLSGGLTDADWLRELAALAEGRGEARRLGPDHLAVRIDGDPDVLLVGFESVAAARGAPSGGIPQAMREAGRRGWSHLSLVSAGETFFRAPEVHAHFDALGDAGFFDAFRRVIFTGAGPSGHAAAAFSAAAPGAEVILVAPLATLDPAVAPWDDRYLAARRRDFTSRYGYAPDMIEAAARVFVLHDPTVELDAMHAALFRGPHVAQVRFRHGGHPLGPMLREMDVLGPAFERAARGELDAGHLRRALRARRGHLPYLRNLLTRLHVEERHGLVAALCRWVLREIGEAPRFRHHLDAALAHMARDGAALPLRETV